MPCTDGGVPYPDHTAEKRDAHIRKIEAMLCALAAAVSKSESSFEIIASIDWNEAGVTAKDVADWLRDHRKIDRKRTR